MNLILNSPKNLRAGVCSYLKLMLMLLLYYGILLLLYKNYIAGVYPGYPDIHLSAFKSIESLIGALLAMFLVPIRWNRPSSFYYSILIISIFYPMCIIYQFGDYSREYFYTVSFTIVLIWIVLHLPTIRIPYLANSTVFFSILMLIFSFTVYAWILKIGWGTFVTSLSDVYKVRLQLRNVIVGVWGYFVPWVAKIILPAFIGFSLYYKKKLLLLFFVLLSLLMFPLTSHKSYGAMAFASIFIYFVFRKDYHTNFTILTTLILAGVAVLLELFGNLTIMSLFVQRSIFKPGLLNFTYYEVFKDLQPIMLSNSSINPFLKYPFDVNPPFLVGEFLKGSIITRSNTGFLGTGYMHFGLAGVPLFGFAVAFLLLLLDSAAKRWPTWLACIITFGPFTAMIRAGDLLPSLVTNGVLLSLILLWGINCEELPLQHKTNFKVDSR